MVRFRYWALAIVLQSTSLANAQTDAELFPGKITCYSFGGTAYPNNTQCSGSNICCQTADLCDPNKFCKQAGQLVVPTCNSDPWGSGCSNICRYESETAFLPRAVECSEAQGGGYCCDNDPKCCSEQRGIVLNGLGSIVSTNAGLSSTSTTHSSSTATSSSTTTTTPPSSSSSTSSSSASSQQDTTQQQSDDGGLSTGAKAGIGAAVALAAVAAIAIVFLVFRRRRRQRTVQHNSGNQPLTAELSQNDVKPELDGSSSKQGLMHSYNRSEKPYRERGSQIQELPTESNQQRSARSELQ